MHNNQNHFYNKALKNNAGILRNNSTKSEIRLWCELLRKGQMKGYTFNRQRPIGNYIADFFCKELGIIIELDGWSHFFEETIDRDRQKQKFFEENGYLVLRFWDEDVSKNIGWVADKIEEAIVQRENKQ